MDTAERLREQVRLRYAEAARAAEGRGRLWLWERLVLRG
jgi:hypothetical protein